jgi:hypothetical protein
MAGEGAIPGEGERRAFVEKLTQFRAGLPHVGAGGRGGAAAPLYGRLRFAGDAAGFEGGGGALDGGLEVI